MTGELDGEAERVLLDTIYCTAGADSWPLLVLTKPEYSGAAKSKAVYHQRKLALQGDPVAREFLLMLPHHLIAAELPIPTILCEVSKEFVSGEFQRKPVSGQEKADRFAQHSVAVKTLACFMSTRLATERVAQYLSDKTPDGETSPDPRTLYRHLKQTGKRWGIKGDP